MSKEGKIYCPWHGKEVPYLACQENLGAILRCVPILGARQKVFRR